MNDELSRMFESDVDEQKSAIPPDKALANVSELAQKQVRLEDAVAEAERILKERKEQLRYVSEVQIPEAFADLGLSDLSLASGEKVSVSTKLKAGITKANEAAAFNWLRDHEAGAIIKGKIEASFGKGEEQQVLKEQAILALAEIGVPAEIKEAVAWNTLTSWVKNEIEDGRPVDTELLGVIELTSTKIVRPQQ